MDLLRNTVTRKATVSARKAIQVCKVSRCAAKFLRRNVTNVLEITLAFQFVEVKSKYFKKLV